MGTLVRIMIVQCLGHIIKGQGADAHGNDIAVSPGYQQGHLKHMPGIKCIEHDPGIHRPCQDIDGNPH